MRIRRFDFSILALFLSTTLPIAGQGTHTRITTVRPKVERIPYTAEFKITYVRVLGDGGTITQESTERHAVDSLGRVMTASTKPLSPSDQQPVTHVTVSEPTENTFLEWNYPDQRAVVISRSLHNPAGPPCSSSSAPGPPTRTWPTTHLPLTGSSPLSSSTEPQPRPTVEQLGTDSIQGVEARGTRIITTIPAGSIGNNESLESTREIWRAVAPGLFGLVVREITDDPQRGKSVKELVSFDQGEPDEAVFQPPSNYEVVNQDVRSGGCLSPDTSVQSTEKDSGGSATQATPDGDSTQGR